MIDAIIHSVSFVFDLLLHIDVHLAEWAVAYGGWLFFILFLVIFCETGLIVTPFLPGDSLLFVTGALAATGAFDIHLMVLTLVIAAILGDSVNFEIGKYFGVRAFQSGKSVIFKPVYLEKTNAFYAKHGGKAIIIARFMPIVRSFAPFVAGMGRMHYPRFLFFNVIGSLIWVMSVSYIGYFFGNIPMIKNSLGIVIVSIIILSMLPAVYGFIASRFKKRQ